MSRNTCFLQCLDVKCLALETDENCNAILTTRLKQFDKETKQPKAELFDGPETLFKVQI